MIARDRILTRLDEHLAKNDYPAAERHLLYWAAEARAAKDRAAELLVESELMGIYRKCGRREDALAAAGRGIALIRELGIAHQAGAATVMLNAATVFKAFGQTEDAIALFREVKAVYEAELPAEDVRRAGLYNNMALALVDAGAYAEARELYARALVLTERVPEDAPEAAVTCLNLASAAEAELGLEKAAAEIDALLDRAEAHLEAAPLRDANYAFVCEKCAPVFDYYGRFFFAEELARRAERIRRA